MTRWVAAAQFLRNFGKREPIGNLLAIRQSPAQFGARNAQGLCSLRQFVYRKVRVLLLNEDGYVTEFTRGNLVVEIEGLEWTPPRECGLLAGIFRGELLAEGRIQEQPLTPAQVRAASRLWFINSLREWVEVRLVE